MGPIQGFDATGFPVTFAAAIAMLLWRPDRRSRRFRDNRFWIALGGILILIVGVLRLYIRGSQMAVFQHEDKPLPNTLELP